MMGQPWDSNGGSSAERGLKLIKPLASPPKLTSIRLAVSISTDLMGKAYQSINQSVPFLGSVTLLGLNA